MSEPQRQDGSEDDEPIVVEELKEHLADPPAAKDDGAYAVMPSGTPSGDVSGSADIDESYLPYGDSGPGWASTRAMTPERDRRYLTGALLIVTVGGSLALGCLVFFSDQEQWARLQWLLAPFQTLLGLAVGYYFAERRNGPA